MEYGGGGGGFSAGGYGSLSGTSFGGFDPMGDQDFPEGGGYLEGTGKSAEKKVILTLLYRFLLYCTYCTYFIVYFFLSFS